MKAIDLTHTINPGKVQRKFSIERIGAETVNPNVVRQSGQWYIMTNINMVSHIGTHIEVPFHLFQDGKDLSEVPLEMFFGPAVVLDFSFIQKRIPITEELCKKAAIDAGGIQKDDIVLCNLGYSEKYGTEAYNNSPYFSEDAIRFLVESNMKMMGVDAGGVEIPASKTHVNHAQLFSHNIPLIENVANLRALRTKRCTVFAWPYPIKGVEAFPVRVVAFV